MAEGRIRVGAIAFTSEVDEWANDPHGPVYLLLDELAVRTQFLARRYVRVRTGRLQNTIRKRRAQGARQPAVDVVAGLSDLTPYLWFEHDGTVPHQIRARNRKTLRFIDRQGRLRFPVEVRHPGTRGSRFLVRAIEEVEL